MMFGFTFALGGALGQNRDSCLSVFLVHRRRRAYAATRLGDSPTERASQFASSGLRCEIN